MQESLSPLIRRAKQKDALAIAQIHVDSWREAYRGIVPDKVLKELSVEQRRRNWEKQIRSTSLEILVAEQSEQMLGWIAFGACRDDDAPQAAEVQAIYLDPSYKRQGIGRSLWSESCTRAIASGQSVLLVWVLEENHPARQFYESMGAESDIDRRRKVTLGGRILFEVRYQMLLTEK